MAITETEMNTIKEMFMDAAADLLAKETVVVENMMRGLEGRIDAKFEGLEEQIDKRLDAVDKRLDDIAADVSQLTTEVQEMNLQVAQLNLAAKIDRVGRKRAK